MPSALAFGGRCRVFSRYATVLRRYAPDRRSRQQLLSGRHPARAWRAAARLPAVMTIMAKAGAIAAVRCCYGIEVGQTVTRA